MKKPYFIGIAGGSASGKSTFCTILENEFLNLNIKVFHMDDYFKPENERPFLKSPIKETMYIDDNHPNTINISKLKLDLYEALDNNFDVIILEGLLTLWYEEIYSKLDLKLFVDCKADERIVRRLKRNMEWGLTFDDVSNVYLDMVRYRHDEYVEPTKWRADLILNGSHISKVSIEAITSLVKNSIK